MFIKLCRVLLFLFISIVFVKDASACARCVFALFDSSLPPTYYWCALGVLWYLSIAVVGLKYKIRVPILMEGKTSIIIVVAVFFGAFLILGPVPLLPVFFSAIVLSLLSNSATGPFKQNKKANAIVGYISAVVFILAVMGGIWSAYILHNRTDAKFYLQWSGTATGRELMSSFRQKEPASLDDYRYIVDHGKGMAVTDAARRIGAIGDPKCDKPRLMAALAKKGAFDTLTIKEAIDSLTAWETGNPGLGRGENRNKKDGSVLIEIPAGSFPMGSNESDEEKPIHTVYLDKYYI